MNLEWRSKWDYRFMDLAKLVASWSKDSSTKVGAVIVDNDNIVRGMGYNGFARGVEDSVERYVDRDQKYELVVHAEENAIINAGHEAKGCRIYVYPTLMEPCSCPKCANLIVQSRIKELVYFKAGERIPGRNYDLWEKKAKFTQIILSEAKVKTRAISEVK